MSAQSRSRVRFYVVVFLLGAASLYAGRRLVVTRPAPPVHPLTGRQIAGTATNASWMDRASREQEEAPQQALTLIGIRANMTVADVGAGSGYMTIRLARLVGPGGKVYASDIQPDLLGIVRQKAEAERLSNIEIVQGTETEARLPDGAIDLELLVDVYHEMWHPQQMLRSLRRSLKPGGLLVLVEYRKEDLTIPIAETHRMSVAEARAELQAEGFTFERAVEALPRQHILFFRKSP